MKALILAAGLGSRLAPLTDDCPKSLVKVNGKSILIKQIENLKENGIEDITIISGYKADILEKKIKEEYPEINIIHSEDYKNTNNMYSAYLASNKLKGQDFLMMNADVFFDSSVIKELIAFEAKFWHYYLYRFPLIKRFNIFFSIYLLLLHFIHFHYLLHFLLLYYSPLFSINQLQF